MLLHLVRHGRPAIDETVPAAHWALDDDAGTEISQLNLSGHLPREGAWFTSPEPKARFTTSLLARCEVMVVADLTGNQPDVASWARMTMPDHYCIDLDGSRLVSDWGEWRSGHGPYSA